MKHAEYRERVLQLERERCEGKFFRLPVTGALVEVMEVLTAGLTPRGAFSYLVRNIDDGKTWRYTARIKQSRLMREMNRRVKMNL